jgi:hypothetical protein
VNVISNVNPTIDAEVWEAMRNACDEKDTDWIIVDLDGTVCDVKHREHLALAKQWDAFNAACVNDTPRAAELLVVTMFYRYAPYHRIAICTGRSEKYRFDTECWLVKYGVPYDLLFMRPVGDHRPDIVVKSEMGFNIACRGRGILFVIEDRQKVVDMWRSNGLTCFQNQPGAY